MDPIALYYPYVHIRDDNWLKYAALYWPKMVRLSPPGHHTSDSPVARALRNDAGWLVDLAPPRWAVREVETAFLDLFENHADVLRDRFGLHRIDDPGRLAYVNVDAATPELVDELVNAGIATVARTEHTTRLRMHPDLADVLIYAVVERISAEDRLHPVTDQSLPHAAVSGWTMERMAHVLTGNAADDHHGERPDLLDTFVLSAFETVVPADLGTVSIAKIIEVRARFGTELDAFREYVTQQTQEFALLRDIRDLAIFREYLQTEVQAAIAGHLAGLRERLRSVGLASARALVNVKSVGLPPAAAMAAEFVGFSPAITGPAVLAACVVGAPTEWRRQRQAAIRESPVGYLFRLDEALNPARLVDRIRRHYPRVDPPSEA